jgi:2-O-(6-phospho-alpha-D-mannosyl)-D-glycerate hydrolase
MAPALVRGLQTAAMRVVLVSHFHWDREWYRTFEDFRSRLVPAIDLVLDQCEHDPGYRFVLDGQAIVLEDYLALRPHRQAELERGVRAGRLGVGPWYVQPDSLLPSGEAHIRNLLIGRRVALAFGAVSRVAYVPDSFGHPAQFPQLFAGFSLDPFVYWRGNGDELDDLAPIWQWRAPDGTAVVAWSLTDGYFGAAGLDADPDTAAKRLAPIVERLAALGHDPVCLMNGFDHLPPDVHTGAVADALARALGVSVTRGLVDDAAAMLDARDRPQYEGALLGGRVANLLPGVWSARMPLKLRNRSCETSLEGWAEPWAAFGSALGLDDERPALDAAWRALLANQAHDSIGGCSIDRVHEQMRARFDTAEELATTTTRRALEALAGRERSGTLPWADEQDLCVFSASPHPLTAIVRVPLDSFPPWRMSIDRFDVHPMMKVSAGAGFTVDGQTARVVTSDDPARVRFLPGQPAFDVEFVATDVPAFGFHRYLLARGPDEPDVVDDGREISAGDVQVRVADEGTLTIRLGDRVYSSLFGVEDRGDRGDSYDFDPVDAGPGAETIAMSSRRTRHVSGIQYLRVQRTFAIPTGLAPAMDRRHDDVVECVLTLDAAVAPAVPWVDVSITLDNRARDHRLRLCFPTGATGASFTAATTFDVASRTTDLPDASRWLHPAPATFPHQGWVAGNGLFVGAPGLPEAEVMANGTIAITLVRSTGWLSRFDLTTRPLPAAPEMAAPGAQVPDVVQARIVLARDAGAIRDAELGLRGVLGGPAPRLAAGTSLLSLSPNVLTLSACKPAVDGPGFIVRVLNPTETGHTAELTVGIPLGDVRSVRLDETPAGDAYAYEDGRVRFDVPAHALRTVHLFPAKS